MWAQFSTLSLVVSLTVFLLSGCSPEQQASNGTADTPATDTSDFPIVTLSYGAQEATGANNILTIPEDSGKFLLTATLSKPYSEPVSIWFALNQLNTTAKILNDFQLELPTEGQPPDISPNTVEVLFKPGDTQISFGYAVLQNDNLYEADEEISFWVAPKLNSVVNLPTHSVSGLPYLQLVIQENRDPPEISISKIKVGNDASRPAVSDITVTENQSIEFTIAVQKSININSTNVKFTLTPELGAVEDVDYGFPFSENRLLPFDTNSEFILSPEQEVLTFFLPLYSKPVQEAPKRLRFTLTDANNGSIIAGSVVTITININDDGNNGFDLNDTGISTCYDDLRNPIAGCTHAEYPNQDGVTATQPQFSKYNFVNEAPTITPSPLAPAATSWNCIYDETTGLLWEKVTDQNQIYTWYDDNPTTNGGAAGQEIDSTGSTIDISGSTQGHAENLNSILSPLCEVGDNLVNKTGKWRLPKLKELLSIMDFETPDSNLLYLDSTLFNAPNSPNLYFWTASPSAIDDSEAWCVSFTKKIINSVKLCKKTVERPAIMVSTVEIVR